MPIFQWLSLTCNSTWVFASWKANERIAYKKMKWFLEKDPFKILSFEQLEFELVICTIMSKIEKPEISCIPSRKGNSYVIWIDRNIGFFIFRLTCLFYFLVVHKKMLVQRRNCWQCDIIPISELCAPNGTYRLQCSDIL